MNSLTARMLASASAAVIATFALAGAASAQGAESPVTGAEAEACAKLATQPERDACIQGQAKDQRGSEESGSADTIAPEERAEQRSETEQTIVVTGSRLRRSTFNSPDPLTVIDPELSMQEGDVELGEILQSSPVASGSTQITSFLSTNFVFNGGKGVETISLRGLGAERTLVLLDGRRAGPSGVRGGVGAFDLNVLPTGIIRSIEVLKTGASSVYGSDAIAGVVNILTKRDTDGIELRAFGSLTEHGGGETYDVSATWGKDFGRGHILVSGNYYQRNALRRRDRDFLDCSYDYVFNQLGERVDILDPRNGDPACLGNSLDGVIGIITNPFGPGANNLAAPPNSVVGTSSTFVLPFRPGSGLDTYAFPLRPPVNATSFGAPAGYYVANYDRNSAGILQDYLNPEAERDTTIIPETTRYTLFASGSYELTDNIEIFMDALYNRRETHATQQRALFANQVTSAVNRQATMNNCPLLTFFGTANPYCNRADNGDPINVGFTGPQVIQPAIYVPYSADLKIDYYRAVGGVRGEVGLFGKPFRWEAWGQYSLSDGDYGNDIIFQDAVDALTLRSRSCVGRTTEIRGVPCVDINLTDPRILTDHNFTDAERAFLFGYETGNTKYKQWTGEATISGDVLDLWAGPLQGSLGVHIRRDSIMDVPGSSTITPNRFYNPALTGLACQVPTLPCNEFVNNSWGLTASGITGGYAITSEAFGEMSVPLFVDRPIVGSMEIDAGARVTNYYAKRRDGLDDKDNYNWTYKLGANWTINPFVRLRGTYGTSYRAPQLFEQFLADQTSFPTQIQVDPCIRVDNQLIAGTIPLERAAACAAQGVPVNYAGLNPSALRRAGGGIGVLDPETSKAWTASVILTPPPIWDGMRISFAVDYFSIKVKGEITNLGALNIVLGCLDSPTFPTDPLCGLFDRINDPTNPQDHMITEVRDPYINVNSQYNRGFDFTLRFTQDFGRWGNFAFLGQATYQAEDTYELFAGTGANDNGEVGDPKWVGDFNFTWTKKPVSLNWNVDYVGATSDRADIRRTLGDDECNPSAIRGTLGNPAIICPDYRGERKFYHSVSLTFDFLEKFRGTIGVNNIFDTEPAQFSRLFNQASTITGAGVSVIGSQYDYLGRRFFAGITAKF